MLKQGFRDLRWKYLLTNGCYWLYEKLIIEIVFIYYWLLLVNQADQVQACIKSNFRTLPTRVAEFHLLQ